MPKDPREVWLRSHDWSQTPDGTWTTTVPTTKGARYRPMSLDHAFEVAVKRCVIEDAFVVEVQEGRVRLALPWREVAQRDLPHEAG